MSGQNHKIDNATKKSSGHTATYANGFFTYKPTTETNPPEVRINPKPGEIGKVHKSMQ
jgi:hypothetical protein